MNTDRICLVSLSPFNPAVHGRSRHQRRTRDLLWAASLLVHLSTRVLAGEPAALPIVNPSFEIAPTDQASAVGPGWVVKASAARPAAERTRVVPDDAPQINRAKSGSHWLLLEAGDAIGQRLGRVEDLLSKPNGADRLFVSLLVSSRQSPAESNDLQLAVELHLAKPARTWEDGPAFVRKTIMDLTNDKRGDPNSYLDASAVLQFDRIALRSRLQDDCWLVIRNTAQPGAKIAAVTLDAVGVNVACPPLRNTRPNIIFALQDDMGYGDTPTENPQSKIQTPNLDRLAARGMTFSDAHTAATICGPSRIGLLTGTMPSKLGVRGNFVPGGNARLGPPTFPINVPTIATLCRAAGYDTAVIGKWGIPSNWDARRKAGETQRLTPENAASLVDFSKPLENADAAGFTYRFICDEYRPFLIGETSPYEGNPTPYGWHENGLVHRAVLAHSAEELHGGYLRVITDRAIRYLQTKAGLRVIGEENFNLGDPQAPFYLHYLTHAPHLPLVPAPQFVGRSELGPYGDFVYDLDYSLGRLVQALDESGLAGNTLIAFSSDNGPETLAYERAKTTGHFSMGPLRGVKRDLYEGGHRVPLVMGWPGVIRPGTRSDALVGLVDWFATVAAIVGQRPPDTSGLDSMNLLPLLRGEVKQVRSHLLIDSCVSGIARGLRIDSWVYLDHESGELNSGRNQEPPWFRELHGVVDAPGAELYDLASDLGQGKNRIAAEPERASRMKDAFDRLWGDAARSTPPFTTQLGKPEKAGRP